jgi:hypothetical protein
VRRREAPPHTIWVLICPDTGGDSYLYNTQNQAIRDFLKVLLCNTFKKSLMA